MRKLQKQLDRKVTLLADELKTTPETIMEVESAMFGFLKHKMGEGDRSTLEFPNVYLRFLGTFYTHKSRLKHLNK